MLKGDTLKLILICCKRCAVKDGSPTELSKTYLSTFWILQLGHVLRWADGFTKDAIHNLEVRALTKASDRPDT